MSFFFTGIADLLEDAWERIQAGLPGSTAPTVGTTPPPPSGGPVFGGAPEPDDDSPSSGVGPNTFSLFPSTGTYSSERPDQYGIVVRDLQEMLGIPRIAQLTSRINMGAQTYLEQFGTWPSAFQLISGVTPDGNIQGYDPFLDLLPSLLTGTYLLPPMFIVDGTIYNNDEFRGPQVVGPATSYSVLPSPTIREDEPIDPSKMGGWEQFIRAGAVGGLTIDNSGVLRSTIQVTSLPVYSQEEFGALLADAQRATFFGSRISTGGGGGSGRQPAAFDTRALNEAAEQAWRAMLIAEPPDLSKWVNDYVADAQAFWMEQGGSLDFEAFLLEKIRGEERYKFLYNRKPEHMNEAEYLSGFAGAAAQFGLPGAVALREIEAGANQGAGIAGFTERLGTLPEVFAGNVGGFSRAFASQVAGLGPLGRA